MSVFVTDERAAEHERPDAGPTGAGAPAVDLDRLGRLARFVADDRGVPEDMELSLLCVDAAAIAALNQQHMGAEGPTDVLAFPLDVPGQTLPGQPAVLGDVVLCPEVAAEQAADRGHGTQQELDLLAVHGILHLLGHDHAEEDERRAMFDLTDRLLAAFAQAEEARA